MGERFEPLPSWLQHKHSTTWAILQFLMQLSFSQDFTQLTSLMRLPNNRKA